MARSTGPETPRRRAQLRCLGVHIGDESSAIRFLSRHQVQIATTCWCPRTPLPHFDVHIKSCTTATRFFFFSSQVYAPVPFSELLMGIEHTRHSMCGLASAIRGQPAAGAHAGHRVGASMTPQCEAPHSLHKACPRSILTSSSSHSTCSLFLSSSPLCSPVPSASSLVGPPLPL